MAMRILITGGTGLIGKTTCAWLNEAGCDVRTLARGEEASWRANITDTAALRGAAADCDVVVHIAGIAAESPPDRTFQRVNVEGTRNLLREAERAGVRRFIYVSSLGADRGHSEYHASKRSAEELVAASPVETVIVRPGNVYGPGDEVLSTLVTFVRALPIIPVIGDGDYPFQPIWHEDVGAAIAAVATRPSVDGVYDIAGPDVITMNQFLDVLGELTGKEPVRFPLPASIVGVAARLAEKADIHLPIKPDTLQMLLDGNYIPEGSTNGLLKLGITPTPLREGVQRLLDSLPEQTLDSGSGKAEHRIIRTRIRTNMHAEALFQRFVDEWPSFMAVESNVESDAPRPLAKGSMLTLALPLRGNIAVRVEEASDQAVTLAALDGHPLAGFVRFTFADSDEGVVFEVNVYDRPASMIDALAMSLGGSYLQKRVWRETAQRVAEAAGGQAETETSTHEMSDDDVARVQQWFDQLTASDRDSRDRPA